MNLNKFLSQVRPQGGQGNEAIEVLFQKINAEKLLDQIILIGDAGPNT